MTAKRPSFLTTMVSPSVVPPRGVPPQTGHGADTRADRQTSPLGATLSNQQGHEMHMTRAHQVTVPLGHWTPSTGPSTRPMGGRLARARGANGTRLSPQLGVFLPDAHYGDRATKALKKAIRTLPHRLRRIHHSRQPQGLARTPPHRRRRHRGLLARPMRYGTSCKGRCCLQAASWSLSSREAAPR